MNDLTFPHFYFWRVRGVNAGGYSGFSESWNFKTSNSLAPSTVFVNVIPQGLYNINSNMLGISDTIKGYLVNVSSPYEIIDSSIVVLDSATITAAFEFPNAETGIYYLKINHRNSIEIWSKNGGEVFNRFGKTYYDFTFANTQAFGDNMILFGDKWCIYSGDVNQDGVIEVSDQAIIDNDTYNSATGYIPSDLNGDSVVDVSDAVFTDNNSFNLITVIRP